MSEQVTRYQDAFARLEAAEQALSSLRTMAHNLNSFLYRPTEIVLSGTPKASARSNVPYNQHVLNLDSWPDAAKLKATIEEWQTARAALETAWQTVPSERRSSLTSPDNAPGGSNRR